MSQNSSVAGGQDSPASTIGTASAKSERHPPILFAPGLRYLGLLSQRTHTVQSVELAPISSRSLVHTVDDWGREHSFPLCSFAVQFQLQQ